MSDDCNCKNFTPKEKAQCLAVTQIKIRITNTECKILMQKCLTKLETVWDKVYRSHIPDFEAEKAFDMLEQSLIEIERKRERAVAEAWVGFHIHYPTEAESPPSKDEALKDFRMIGHGDEEMDMEKKIRDILKGILGENADFLSWLQLDFI